jgi:hypothetical protein
MSIVDGAITTPRGGDTVIVALACTRESLTLRAVTTAVPGATAVTSPCADTLATAGSALVHVTLVDTPSSALTSACSVVVLPTRSVAVLGEMLTANADRTNTVMPELKAPVRAVTTATPRPTAVIVAVPPLALTLATAGASLLQFTVCPASTAPPASRTVAVTELVLPIAEIVADGAESASEAGTGTPVPPPPSPPPPHAPRTSSAAPTAQRERVRRHTDTGANGMINSWNDERSWTRD